mgnify:CR=1 FL=1
MARMYKSRKGKSGSNRPFVSEAPEWSNTDAKAVTELILDLGKAGHSTAEIGTILRDQHAVPNVRLVLGKRIGAVLAENVGGPVQKMLILAFCFIGGIVMGAHLV